eukprot:m.84913 g.84913  ORF g.84913 m.84913 type:complete len:397 (-) comp25820_c0_seq1:112-1302(-)
MASLRLLVAACASILCGGVLSSQIDSNGMICSTDSDCELNGHCDVSSGQCECDRAWSGPTCGVLDIDSGKPAYGFDATPNTSCWGGGPPILDPVTKKYHMYVTEIAGNCGMGCWSRMSQTAHTIGDSVDGPFTRVGLAIPKQTHNTYYAYSPLDKKHLIYSIFSGENPESCNPSYKCTNGSSPYANGLRTPSGKWPAATCGPQHGDYIHVSDSIDGPWTNAGAINITADHGSSNPAPWIFANGTVLMLGRSKDAGVQSSSSGRHADHNIWLYRAASWNSTYEWIPSNGVNGSVGVGNGIVLTEDPVLWQGRRGFHAIFHSHPLLSHGWSEDGLSWSWSGNLTGPPVHNGMDHERPRVVLDDNGDIDALFVSTLLGNYLGDDAAQLRVFRPNTPAAV